MRKLLAVIVIALAVATGIAISTLKAEVERASETVSEYVRIHGRRLAEHGEVHIKLLPPSIEVTDVTIVDKKEFATKFLFSAPRLRVYPRLLPMLIGQAAVSSVRVFDSELHIVRTHDRELNVGAWFFGSPSERESALPVPVRFSDMQITFDDRTGRAVTLTKFTSVDLEADRAGDDGATSFELSAGLGDDTQALSASGSFRRMPLAEEGTSVKVSYRVNSLEVEQIRSLLLEHPDLALAGTLSLVGEAHGFIGSYGGEDRPAETLELTAKGSCEFEAREVVAPLTFDAEMSIKPNQLRINRADVVWGDLPLTLRGWTHLSSKEEVSIKVSFDEIDTDKLLRKYSVSDRWRPRMKLSGVIKVIGPAEKPRFHYEADASDFSMDFFEGLEITIDTLDGLGVVLAINAEIAYTVDATGFKVGTMELPAAHFGGRYWKDKVSVGIHEAEMWGGVASIKGAYRPTEDRGADVSVVFDDLDASEFLLNAFPDFDPRLKGRVDAIMRFGAGSAGYAGKGRVGVHRGRWDGLNLTGTLLGELSMIDGLEALEGADFRDRYPELAGSEHTKFEKVKFDFQSGSTDPENDDAGDGVADGTYRVGGIRVVLDGLGMAGKATVDDDGSLAADVWLALSEQLSADVVATVPFLSRLLAGDRRLHVPAHVTGRLAELSVEVDDAFVDAVARARSGESVQALVARPNDGDLGLDLPTLDEEYAR